MTLAELMDQKQAEQNPAEEVESPPKKLKRARQETKEEFEAKYMDVNKQYEPIISKDEDDDSDAGFVH